MFAPSPPGRGGAAAVPRHQRAHGHQGACFLLHLHFNFILKEKGKKKKKEKKKKKGEKRKNITVLQEVSNE